MSVLFHPLRVRAVEPDTAEAVIVSFDVPTELREAFGFTQGQYLTLRKTIAGVDLRRSVGTSKETITASAVSGSTARTRRG